MWGPIGDKDQPMNSIKQNVSQEYKACAGRGCQNTGIHRLEIRFLHKSGWFCNACKTSLIADNLVANFRSDDDLIPFDR